MELKSKSEKLLLILYQKTCNELINKKEKDKEKNQNMLNQQNQIFPSKIS